MRLSVRLRIQLAYLRHNALYVVAALLVAFTFSTVFGSFVISTNAATAKTIHDAEVEYGYFHVIFGGLDDDRIRDIAETRGVDSQAYYVESLDDEKVGVFCAESALAMLGVRTLVGEFPDSPGAVMVERSTASSLFEFGDYGELIGRTVRIGDDDYTMSGVYFEATSSFTNVYVLNGAYWHGGVGDVAIRFNGSSDINARVSELHGGLDLPSTYDAMLVNVPLLTAMGYGPDGIQQTILNASLLLVLALVLVLMAAVILGNVVDLLIDRNLKAFGVHMVLQSSIGAIARQILVPVYVVVVLGVVGGFAVSKLFNSTVIKTSASMAGVQPTPFPVWECLMVGTALLVLCVALSLVKLRRISRLTPIAVLASSRMASTRMIKSKGPLFTTNSRFVVGLRLLRSMVGGGARKGLVIMVGVSLAVVVNVLMANFWAAPDSTATMAYDFELVPDEMGSGGLDGSTTLSQLRRATNVVTVYDTYQAGSWFTIDKAAISAGASKALSRSEFRNRMRDKFNSQVTLPIQVIGYTDEEIRMLGIGGRLGDDDCIVFDASFSKFGVKQIFSRQDLPLTVRYDTVQTDALETKAATLYPRFSSDSLLFPVTERDYSTVVMVNLRVFQQMFPGRTPVGHYLVANPSLPAAHEQILGMVTGSSDLSVIDQQQVNEQHDTNNKLAHFLFGFFIGVTVLFSVVNIFSLFWLKLRNNRDRYASYLILGTRRRRIMAVFAVEAAAYFLISIMLSYSGLRGILGILNTVLSESGINYSVVMPDRLWLVFQGGLAVVLLLVLARLFSELRNLPVHPHTIIAE